jgi:hypothetical protein
LSPAGPNTGAVSGSWTFDPGGNTSAVDPQAPGWIWRQKFNSDFTELAASGPQTADGSTTAGYVNANGSYTALTEMP